MTLLLPAAAPAFVADLARHGDRPAVLTDGGALTYASLAARVDDVARRLGPVRRLVVLAARNDVASLVEHLGALAGGLAVLLVPPDRPAAVDDILATYDPDVLLGRDGGELVLDEVRPGTRHVLHEDLALLLSTSGSTGSPKLVRLSRASLQANADAIAESLGIRTDDRAVTTLPIHYCYGLSVVNSHLARGAAVVLTGHSVVDSCFWALVRETRATTFAAVPYTFELLDRASFPAMDLPDLRYVTQAGGRLAPDVARRYRELGRTRGWDLVVMYGQTEATARMAYLPPALAETGAGTIGLPLPGGAFELEPVPGLDEAELVYTGPNVMLGYAESPADLALGRTVHRLRTGDLARRRPDGLVELVGRRSRFVKVAGLRVDLGRVEDAVVGLGATGAVSGTDGRVVVAVEGVADPDLLATVLVADLGLPRGSLVVRSVDRLPRLPSGKVDHPAVLALADAPLAAPAPSCGGRADVRRIVAEELGLADVPDDASFVDLGGDSLSYVATSVRLEEALGDLPADWHVTPVGRLAALADDDRPARRLLAPLDTSITVRAVATVLIVVTHVGLADVQGSAHVLLAVAGYNFARFGLVGERRERLRRHLRSIGRIVLPSVALIAVAHALTDKYSAANVLLLNALVGPETWTTQWHFWFVEVLVYLLVGLTALLLVPWVDRAERRAPFAFPLVLVGAGLATRFELVDLAVPHTAPVLWLFALGWAMARAGTTARRLALSAVAILAVPGFFGDPLRELLVVLGLLLLAWRRDVAVPAVAHRALGLLAGASLHIYLVHWLVYPVVAEVDGVLAVVASLAAGVAYWALARQVAEVARRWGRDRGADVGNRVKPAPTVG